MKLCINCFFKGAKKSVSFKQQNYHCVYEYPRDDNETFELDIGPIWDRTPNYFDLSSFSGMCIFLNMCL